MSDTKFTPGPWAVENHFDEPEVVSCNERDANEKEAGVIYVIAGRIGGMVHGESFDDFSEVEANRFLIAAAPDLYAALQSLASCRPSMCCDDFHHQPGDYHGDEESCPALDRYEAAYLSARAALAKARGES